MNVYRKRKGSAGENVALAHYLDQGYILLDQNYQKRGGELDLVMRKDDTTVFVEVKVVDHVHDLHDYVTTQKLYNLKKTIEAYVRKYNLESDLRLDVVFVKYGSILEIIPNIPIGEED